MKTNEVLNVMQNGAELHLHSETRAHVIQGGNLLEVVTTRRKVLTIVGTNGVVASGSTSDGATIYRFES